jgi:hypothetical protein
LNGALPRFARLLDVIWFDAGRCSPEVGTALETLLRGLDPTVMWSVKNQARMDVQNGDGPHLSATDAMRYWPETATASPSDYERQIHVRSQHRWALMIYMGWLSGRRGGLPRRKQRSIKTA